jgi:large subunit ribosomal protein L9
MANKLLLLADVDALGRSGDVVSVRPGYARNFLLPQGLAVIANKHALRMQVRLQEERKKQALIDKAHSEELATRLQGMTLSTIVKVDHEGHMYGSVSAHDIAHLLKAEGVEIEKRSIQLPHALKETGVHTIKIKLKEGVLSTFTLKVVPEEVPGGALADKSAQESAAGA